MEAVGSPAGGDNPELARRIAAQHPIGTCTHILINCRGVARILRLRRHGVLCMREACGENFSS